MKKIINDPTKVVNDTLAGLAYSNPSLEYLKEYNVILKREIKHKVGLVSGGGSGHEPAQAGYVGEGMLDAAVCGNVFASPGPEAIYEGIKKVNRNKGVLLIVTNYSGDIMNFDMAKELAEVEGVEVETVIVNDDVAVEDSTFTTGRRGIAGTVLIHKIAGAKAEMGFSLSQVKSVTNKAIANIRSFGISLSSCIIPSVGKEIFDIGEDEMEIGMGVHGEPGVERTKIKTSLEIAEIMIDRILNDFDYSNSEVALMINGLGATSVMELNILAKDVHELLKTRKVAVYKAFVGNYMTSMEMRGCSITLLKIDSELKELLDYPCNTTVIKI